MIMTIVFAAAATLNLVAACANFVNGSGLVASMFVGAALLLMLAAAFWQEGQ
jgi:hypothetical protein